jgi:hypothetical protein
MENINMAQMCCLEDLQLWCVGVGCYAACRIYSCGVLEWAVMLPVGSTLEVWPERSVLTSFNISSITTLQFPAYCCFTGHITPAEPRSTATDPIKLHYCTFPVIQTVNCNRQTDCSEWFCRFCGHSSTDRAVTGQFPRHFLFLVLTVCVFG